MRHAFGSIAIDRAAIAHVQAWVCDADVQTTMNYTDHRGRVGDARVLLAGFRPKKKLARKRQNTAATT